MLREIWFEVQIPVCMKDFAKQPMPVSITWIRSADKLLTLTLTTRAFMSYQTSQLLVTCSIKGEICAPLGDVRRVRLVLLESPDGKTAECGEWRWHMGCACSAVGTKLWRGGMG